ncbi:hypothetical protein FQA47_006470 [Oryzias melastigma]|uniref:Uncharacterized protein n=1 Tax=Oryzias melastigma TaxID=30732 RepID=A0A834KXT8_ORYME|nr:hypothetical protein FQA47_006470 [Oryzias melastigma]
MFFLTFQDLFGFFTLYFPDQQFHHFKILGFDCCKSLENSQKDTKQVNRNPPEPFKTRTCCQRPDQMIRKTLQTSLHVKQQENVWSGPEDEQNSVTDGFRNVPLNILIFITLDQDR